MSAYELAGDLDQRQVEILCKEVTRRAEAAYAALIRLEQRINGITPLPPTGREYEAAIERARVRYLSLCARRCHHCE